MPKVKSVFNPTAQIDTGHTIKSSVPAGSDPKMPRKGDPFRKVDSNFTPGGRGVKGLD